MAWPLEQVTHSELPGLDELSADELAVVDERQQLVLRMRSGLTDGKKYTLDEVGEMIGVGKERVRQIQNAALMKILRHREAQQRER